MTPPRRKTVGYLAGLLISAGAGFGSHWVPALVREAPVAAVPAAQAAQESPSEQRLRAIENKQEAILTELRDIRETLAFVRGSLKLGSGK